MKRGSFRERVKLLGKKAEMGSGQNVIERDRKKEKGKVGTQR